MLKKAYLLAASLLAVYTAGAQTTFLPLGSENYHTLDRLETLSGRLCDSLAMGDKPESRRSAVSFLMKEQADSTRAPRLSNIDRYNMEQMVSESGEWAPDEHGAIDSKHPWFNAFYKKQYNFAYVKTNNFFLVVNPVFNGTVTMQNNDPGVDPVSGVAIPKQVYINSHGAEARGWIAKKIGFYTMFTDNQERFPYPVYNYVNKKLEALPGADYYKRPLSPFGTYDYFQASGYINFDAVKNYVNVTFGYGKNFIGDGISSLFLSDNSASMPFLKLRARIWKLNYECLYLELTPQFLKTKDEVLPHKYASIHYLSWNATRWLNLGFFEAQTFDRTGGYEISYLNPIILSTTVSRYNGAGDKSMLGFNVKTIFAKHFQLYSQVLLNEFRVKELTGGNGWYGNKFGVQAGGKYFDAFGIKNLDLQGEVDMVRPYTYSAQDTLANYTNYNQPMADPLGSGFVKAIGLIKYQPVKNVYLTLKATYYMRGNDRDSLNQGNNIFKAYPTAAYQYGVSLINGPQSNCMILGLNVSYQLRRNIFLDLGGSYRKYESADNVYPHSSTTGTYYGPLTSNTVYFGIRINAARRDYDFL